MPKPKARSRYIRRIHKIEERLRRALEQELRELQEYLSEATIEEIRASLNSISSEDTSL